MSETLPQKVLERFKEEVVLAKQAFENTKLWPLQLYVFGFLLLWLASWPWGLGQAKLFDLPQEPLFSFSHLLVLLGALCLVAGCTLTFKVVLKGYPYPKEQKVYHWQHPLWGTLECWAGLFLIVYILIVLKWNVLMPGFLMGDRLGRLAFWVFPLLYRGAGLTLAYQLPFRQGRQLLDSSLAVMLLALITSWYNPYIYLDGQFFGPQPRWEAVCFGVLFTLGVTMIYWYGLRYHHTGSARSGEQLGAVESDISNILEKGEEKEKSQTSEGTAGTDEGTEGEKVNPEPHGKITLESEDTPEKTFERAGMDSLGVSSINGNTMAQESGSPNLKEPLAEVPETEKENVPNETRNNKNKPLEQTQGALDEDRPEGTLEGEPKENGPECKDDDSRYIRMREGLEKRFGRQVLKRAFPALVLVGLLCIPPVLGGWLMPAPDPYKLEDSELRLEYSDPLDRSLWLGADWLLRDQNLDGSFRYMYALNNDTYMHLENMIRQAGTAYVMAYICAFTQDPGHCDAAERAMDFIVAQLEYDDTGAFILYHSRAVLGGTALSLVALAHYQLATGSKAYSDDMKEMADHIVSQQYANGSFDGIYKYFWFSGYDKHVSVYAGEALYALALMYRLYGTPAYKETYDRALPWYRDYWNETYDTNLYAWAAKAGYHMYLATGDPTYAAYTYDMSDWIVSRQNLVVESDGYGSFVGIISINSGTYTEGVGDALYLAAALNHTKKVERYSKAINLSARSVAKLQVDGELAELGPRPLRSLGCFRSRMEDYILRIDYAQHALAAIQRHLQWEAGFYQTEPDGVALE